MDPIYLNSRSKKENYTREGREMIVVNAVRYCLNWRLLIYTSNGLYR